MKPLGLLLLSLLVSFMSWTQEPTSRPSPETTPKVFNTVERVGEDNLRSFYMFSVSGHDYTLRADGRGERSFANARSRNFTLRVDQSHIEQVYFLEHEGDLLLIYQLSDKRGARGYVVRINQTSLKFIWSKPVDDLKFDSAVVEAGYLTLRTASAVMKIDLQSGALVEK